MPPGGLWPIPRHHVYSGSMPRSTFNTKDFEEDEEKIVATGNQSMSQRGRASEIKQEGEKKQRKKRKKKHSDVKREGHVAKTVTTASSTPTMTPNTKAKRSEEKKKDEGVSPVSRSSTKKRKRESEGKAGTPTLTRITSTDGNGSFVIGEDMAKGLETSMNGLGAQFTVLSQAPEKEPKRKKSSRNSKNANRNGESNDGRQLSVKLGDQPKTATKILETPNTKEQKSKKKSMPTEPTVAPKSPYSSVPKKSYVPIPPSSKISASIASHGMQAEDVGGAEKIRVSETPPSALEQTPRTGRVPSSSFSRSSFADALKAALNPSKKERLTHIQAPKSVPVATPRPRKKSRTSKVTASLSPAVLNKIIQSLPDEKETKTHLKGESRATSVATSIQSSSASSTGLLDSFDLVGKPYARSGAVVDPFTQPEKKKRKHRETHEEAQSMKVFNERFKDAQKAVNFTDEEEYLNKYIDWHAENDSDEPPACLGAASGCTQKKEMILRLSKEDNLDAQRFLETDDSNQAALNDAVQRSLKAEEFLMMAVRARIPVPIGRLEGTWTLYCPKYAEHHFDRYGYGMRTLTIYSVAGYKSENKYTARLSIPPRSTAFTIPTFSAPPHASFRTTTLKTSPEGYKVEVIFLGNGYLQLRFDLNLLLRGKPTEMVGGKKMYMEFVGVHKKALQWVEEKNELEEEGKKLFAKYGGVDDD